jgi:hypothetical protein
MGEISVYSFEDANGDDHGTFTTMKWDEAKEYAQRYGLRVIENVYEWTEAVPVPGFDFSQPDEDEDQ